MCLRGPTETKAGLAVLRVPPVGRVWAVLQAWVGLVWVALPEWGHGAWVDLPAWEDQAWEDQAWEDQAWVGLPAWVGLG